MKLLAALLSAGVLAPACLFAAAPAEAACTGYLTVKDGLLTTQQMAAISAGGLLHDCHVIEGQDSITAGPVTTTVDHNDFGLWSHTTNGALETGHIANVDTSASAQAAAMGTKADAKSTATDTTPASVVALLKGEIDRLQALITALGSPAQAGATQTITGAVTIAGPGNFAPTQVTVGTTAVLIVAARTGRATLTIENTGTTPIYVGGAGVTTSTGFPIPGAAGASLTLAYTGALYGISASGTAVVGEYETY